MLGVFLLGMLTRRRGSDFGNMIAITLALVTTIVLGELHIYVANMVAGAIGAKADYVRPSWLPKVAFTWFALIGAVVVFGVGMFFTTPRWVLDEAEARKEQASRGEDKPIALRET